MSSHKGSGFLLRANNAVGLWEARGGGVAVHGHPGASTDEQVATDGAGVGNLTLAHRGRSCALGPSLTELVNLMHNSSQVSLTALVQPSCHGKWNG